MRKNNWKHNFHIYSQKKRYLKNPNNFVGITFPRLEELQEKTSYNHLKNQRAILLNEFVKKYLRLLLIKDIVTLISLILSCLITIGFVFWILSSSKNKNGEYEIISKDILQSLIYVPPLVFISSLYGFLHSFWSFSRTIVFFKWKKKYEPFLIKYSTIYLNNVQFEVFFNGKKRSENIYQVFQEIHVYNSEWQPRRFDLTKRYKGLFPKEKFGIFVKRYAPYLTMMKYLVRVIENGNNYLENAEIFFDYGSTTQIMFRRYHKLIKTKGMNAFLPIEEEQAWFKKYNIEFKKELNKDL